MNKNQNPGARKSPEERGAEPFALNIDVATMQNEDFRRVVWTGCNLQATLMCIPVGGEIGIENHEGNDQFIKIVSGRAAVAMGCNRDCRDFKGHLTNGSAVFIPEGTWHNVVNTGSRPLKLYSVYAPPHHPKNAVQRQAESGKEKHDECRECR